MDSSASAGTGGEERGSCRDADWPFEVLQRHLGQRRALDVGDTDDVDGDVNAAEVHRDRVGVLIDRRLVERVEDGPLGADHLDVSMTPSEPLTDLFVEDPAGRGHRVRPENPAMSNHGRDPAQPDRQASLRSGLRTRRSLAGAS
jgi:hypothetical protein